ncbi:MAG TPA: hypothetical protein PKV72_03470, partial [Candidatus Peribacteria bacterium]|nr:hypothetical protein [Candidatus Peribacteria bacterium]
MFSSKNVVSAGVRTSRVLVAASLALGMLLPAAKVFAARDPELSWIRQFGAVASSNETARAVDDDGNTFVAGTTDGALSGKTNAGGIDGWLKKYDAHGNLLFTDQFGTAGDDVVAGIAFDQSGIHVIGSTTGTFPGQTSAGGKDIFVRKYDPALDDEHTTLRQFGTDGDDEVMDATEGSANDYFIAGRTSGAFPEKTNAGGFDAYVIRLDGSDNVYWVDQFGSEADDVATSVDKKTAAAVFVAGTTNGTLPDNASAGGSDAFFRQINTDSGNAIETTQFGTAENEDVGGVAILNDELAVVAGTTLGSFPGFTNAGGKDAFAKAFVVQTGAFEWTQQFGTSADDIVNGIGHAIGERLAFVVGTTAGAFPGQTNAGGTDVFIHKLDTWSGQT